MGSVESLAVRRVFRLMETAENGNGPTLGRADLIGFVRANKNVPAPHVIRVREGLIEAEWRVPRHVSVIVRFLGDCRTEWSVAGARGERSGASTLFELASRAFREAADLVQERPA